MLVWFRRWLLKRGRKGERWKRKREREIESEDEIEAEYELQT